MPVHLSKQKGAGRIKGPAGSIIESESEIKQPLEDVFAAAEVTGQYSYIVIKTSLFPRSKKLFFMHVTFYSNPIALFGRMWYG